jgi:hypothetical protein
MIRHLPLHPCVGSRQIDADGLGLSRLRIGAHFERDCLSDRDFIAFPQCWDVEENVVAAVVRLMKPNPLSSLNILILPPGMLLFLTFSMSLLALPLSPVQGAIELSSQSIHYLSHKPDWLNRRLATLGVPAFWNVSVAPVAALAVPPEPANNPAAAELRLRWRDQPNPSDHPRAIKNVRSAFGRPPLDKNLHAPILHGGDFAMALKRGLTLTEWACASRW